MRRSTFELHPRVSWSEQRESDPRVLGGNQVPHRSAMLAYLVGGAVGLSPTLHGTGSALGFRLAARPESPRSLRSSDAGAGCGNRTRLGSLTEGGPHLETEPAKIRVTAECVVHGLSTDFDSLIDCCLTIRRFPHKGGESWIRTNNLACVRHASGNHPVDPRGGAPLCACLQDTALNSQTSPYYDKWRQRDSNPRCETASLVSSQLDDIPLLT